MPVFTTTQAQIDKATGELRARAVIARGQAVRDLERERDTLRVALEIACGCYSCRSLGGAA